jgi:hypothetical protein
MYTSEAVLSTLLGVALLKQEREGSGAVGCEFGSAFWSGERYFIKVMARVEESPPEVSL